MELIEIVHPSGEHFKVNADDLRGDLDVLIPLYELDDTKRSRADAWLGSGKPSDIQRRTAIECRVVKPQRTAVLAIDVRYDPQLTDAEGVATALDGLLRTALDTPGILEEYGNPVVEPFFMLMVNGNVLTPFGKELVAPFEDEICLAWQKPE